MTGDHCDHGIDYDDECAPCNDMAIRAQAAGAWTPKEIGLWSKGYQAGINDCGAA